MVTVSPIARPRRTRLRVTALIAVAAVLWVGGALAQAPATNPDAGVAPGPVAPPPAAAPTAVAPSTGKAAQPKRSGGKAPAKLLFKRNNDARYIPPKRFQQQQRTRSRPAPVVSRPAPVVEPK